MNSTANTLNERSNRMLPVGDGPLTIDDIASLALGIATPVVTGDATTRMLASAEVVARHHEAGAQVYGVTTSFGASVGTAVPPRLSGELSLNLLRMHGCGTGPMLTDEQSAAVLAVRLASLVAGRSGVRPIVAERIAELLSRRILPLIPSEGSVGASGDLTPLSYVAAVLVGEREVRVRGAEMPAIEALRAAGIAPIVLGPKEGLALMNGTSVATAIGCLAFVRAQRIARLSATLTAMTSLAVRGNAQHFDAYVHASKPHPGQVAAARWILEDLGAADSGRASGVRLQDRYSIRCAPHVIGVLVDALQWSGAWIETELNGVSDNPVIDVERDLILHGGNFYGGHVGFAFDALKLAVANVACLLDRQMSLLCNPAENDGLPANLVGVSGDGACAHNGFKAVTIATSALAAEALKLTMPATAFSRSTELHNQDKVPMAPIAARDLVRIVEITEQVAAMSLLACCQAIDLRGGAGESERAREIHAAVRLRVAPLVEDRRMDIDIAEVTAALRDGALPVDGGAM